MINNFTTQTTGQRTYIDNIIGRPYNIFVMFDNAKTLIADPGRCFMKFVAHAETRELLGAQLMCEHASDMIGGISQALANHMTVDQFLLAMRPHPSFEEAMTAALEDLAQKLG